jgi:hypothetical protein
MNNLLSGVVCCMLNNPSDGFLFDEIIDLLLLDLIFIAKFSHVSIEFELFALFFVSFTMS